MKKILRLRCLKPVALIVLQAALMVVSCASPPELSTEQPIWRDNDNKPITEPEFDEPSLIWLTFKRTGPDQIRELLDVDRNIRKLTNSPTQAKNTNSYDEVPNSSWFTNRHGYPATHLTEQQILTGQKITTGPDTNGAWQVFRPKIGGATPGFWIEDARGDQYLIKFDPVGNPEMATAAAAMGSRYFYACGFNVPQETIVYWKPRILQVKEGATVKLPDGTRRALTLPDIDSMLANVHHEPNGTIRSLASLNLGNVKGPFMYDGVNKADSNDWCPHQHRRELRALRVIGSFVNHYDLKDHNSMDVYHGEPNQGHLKHYLLDFGSTFGSDGKSAKIPRKGYANTFDLRDVLVTAATAGLKTWAWENAKGYRFPSIGYFESELFEPHKFDPIIPNPAFEQMTNQDAYWGAKIVMAFDDADLKALVEAGEFSNPKAANYLLQTLRKRREKIGRHWFSKVNPIDYPIVTETDSSLVINFTDLWITSGLGEKSNHQFYLGFQDKKVIELRPTENNSVRLDQTDMLAVKQLAKDCGESVECDLFEISVFSIRDGRAWKKPTKFTLRLGHSNQLSRIVSIEHLD